MEKWVAFVIVVLLLSFGGALLAVIGRSINSPPLVSVGTTLQSFDERIFSIVMGDIIEFLSLLSSQTVAISIQITASVQAIIGIILIASVILGVVYQIFKRI